MTRKSDRAGKTEKSIGLSLEDELKLRAQFNLLVKGMQSPESNAAYEWLFRISAEETREQLRKLRTDGNREMQKAPVADPVPLGAEPIPLSRADELPFPCLVAASLNYFGTGEGHLLGLMITSANSAKELGQEVVRAWGEHRLPDVQVYVWNGGPDRSTQLTAEPLQRILEKSVFGPSALHYLNTLYVNYA